MMGVFEHIHPAWIGMSESLLIGLLVGVERESDSAERHAGLRDFITIGMAGGLCGVIANAWITAAVLIAITTLIVVFRVQTAGRTGVTTELAAVATFLLCVLTATPHLDWASPLAIALAVIFALVLEAQQSLKRFFTEIITDREYKDTLRFLAVIFVILPVLPDMNLGPYGFFNPRGLWIFVILVCSISWLGYFLQKFMGEGQGLRLTGLLGGIASTTASTSALSKECAADQEHAPAYLQAALLSNSVQAPRLFVLLWISAPMLAFYVAPALIAMTVTGLACAFLLGHRHEENRTAPQQLSVKNPFRLMPALEFGALFAIIRFCARFGASEFGAGGVYLTGAIAGSVDADAVAFSLSGMLSEGRLQPVPAAAGVVVAIAANFVLKGAIAWSTAGGMFARRLTIGFVLMTLAAALGTLVHF